MHPLRLFTPFRAGLVATIPSLLLAACAPEPAAEHSEEIAPYVAFLASPQSAIDIDNEVSTRSAISTAR